ncbi:MAG TPA: permease [Acidimicrobiales bacterium]
MIHAVGLISLADIGESVKEAFFMFWATLWALVLGFALSGAVQAFVSKEDMQRTMGDHGAPAVTRATGFGMMSSSCSYAATAMSKSLFQKGADFVTAMVFMFASTNLVIELGVVLLILMGWQFAAAEFVGGPIMILLLVIVGAYAFNRHQVEQARRRLQEGQTAGKAAAAGRDHEHDAMVGLSEARHHELDQTPWREKLTSKGAWADAATYSMADIKMLRKELLIGYGVAGFLAVLVPMDVWNNLFIPGHGLLTTIENVVIGPLIACISFVCSVGNVPMAAALWHGGISFGGVISFVFADLIALPLLLIYRKYYGTKLALRLFLTFWLVMSVAGLAVEGLFGIAGAIPTDRPHDVVAAGFEWNYTTVLNIVFLGVLGLLYWLARNRARLGGGDGYALDPVCGMQVRTVDAPATRHEGERSYWFCSDACADRFDRSLGSRPG